MQTEQIFKKIYEDLRREILENTKTTFLKEYTIPSINYSSNSNNIEDLYFTSRIEMELYQMMEYFNNKIYFISYKDKYFFSNNQELLQSRMLLQIKSETMKEKTKRLER